MNPSFNTIESRPENEIFSIVFYPDRIYHAQYLNATRSPRYRYYVAEVRNKFDLTVLKGMVFLDGIYLCNFLRIEYRATRLVEFTREKERFLRDKVQAYLRLNHEDSTKNADGMLTLHWCPWIDAFQVEIWETLEAPPTKRHAIKVAQVMSAKGSITRVPRFNPALDALDGLSQVELSFCESETDDPYGYKIPTPEWDNDYFRSYQVPNTQTPSAPENTVSVQRYLVDFQRGWFFDDVSKILPVRYENAMLENVSPDYNTTPGKNIIEMRWIVQRELGGSLVYFHEVTIPPGCVEGTHRHVGSEELYYIFEGEGVAYMGDGDDPELTDPAKFPQKSVEIYCLGPRKIRQVPVKPRSVIYTKSGGIHGIRNTGTVPLRFVAFGYHGS